jgi:carboxylesterase type B
LAELKKKVISKWINLLTQDFFDDNLSYDIRIPLSNFATKFLFTCGVRFFMKTYNKYQSNIYAYVFDYALDFKYRFDEPYCTGFACHVDDMPFVFGNPKRELTSKAQLLSRQMNYWTDFSKISTPNSGNDFSFRGNKYYNPRWPIFNPDTSLEITFTNTTNIVEKYRDSCKVINAAFAIDESLFKNFG